MLFKYLFINNLNNTFIGIFHLKSLIGELSNSNSKIRCIYALSMEKIWNKKAINRPERVIELAKDLSVTELIATLLINRSIDTFDKARDFFRPSLEHLYDPFLMKDMDKAIERLTEAVHKGEKILVYGDYDVDGATAVTLVYSFLKNLDVQCDYYIPDRYKEGYGFSFAGVDFAAENGISLIITLDCGIKDGLKIDYAAEKGIDVIVCDHHNPGEIPKAIAVLDPKRSDCEYPFKGLSGCGVGFKMLQAFCIQHDLDTASLMSHLDLLTISIGADIVPLVDENRILAHFGLKILSLEKRLGISAMLEEAKFVKQEMTITDVVFQLAPRINAAGRIFSGKQAVELLLSNNFEEAATLSKALEANNTTRKGLDKNITIEAKQIVQNDSFYNQSFTTVVRSNNWHKGVVGIVASRLVEEYYKPTIVLVETEEKLSGSARSIPGIDLFDALGECSHLLEQFGGHTMAAGLSLKPENFEAFRQKFDDAVARMLNSVRPKPFEEYDAEINFEDIDKKFVRILNQFAPFGPENMKPSFLIKNVQNARFTKTVGADNLHLKLHATQAGQTQIEMNGIGFNLGAWIDQIVQGKKKVDILCTIEENQWNGNTTIQLNLKDVRLSDE